MSPLEHAAGRVSGRIGGPVGGFDVVGRLEPNCIEVRMGGEVVGEDLHLERLGDRFTGRYGGRITGKDVKLSVVPGPATPGTDMRLEGRIGSPSVGKDVNLAGNAPPELAALLGVVTYKLLEDAESAAASSGS